MAKAPKSGVVETAAASDSVDAEVHKGEQDPHGSDPNQTTDAQGRKAANAKDAPTDPQGAPVAAQGDAAANNVTSAAGIQSLSAPNSSTGPVAGSDEGSALGLPVGQVTDATHAAQLLKSKLSLLHTVVHNMGHYSTLAFNDVEALVSDIKYLVNLIRSKV